MQDRFYDPRDYIFIVDTFIETGLLPGGMEQPDKTLSFDAADPMMRYIVGTLCDPHIQSRVLTSKIMGLAFRDMMATFIINVCQKISYQYNRMSGEEQRAEEAKNWNPQKRHSGGQGLLQQIDQDHREDGFDKNFYEHLFSKQGYADDEKWGKMCDDWKQSIHNKLKTKIEEEIKARGDSMKKAFDARMDSVKKQLDSNGVSDFEALQAWQMMDGQWTETEFEKIMNLVRLQDRYPDIARVCKRMGRIPDDASHEQMKVASGMTFKMEHASGSDIEGVTMGNDFNSLLPHEVAQFSDNELEDLFYQRFVTRKLQMFRYKSEMNKPSRKLNFQHASRKGPMVVCVDSSASMKGVPQKIAASLLLRLETTAEQFKRNCFVIDFSVDIRPIDLRHRLREYKLNALGMHKVEEDFSKGLFPFLNGGTDATKMLEKTFQLLTSDPSYQNADVLWISDFLIPIADKHMLRRLQQFRSEGTKLYGFRIGSEPTEWSRYFDKIYTTEYRKPRRF